MFPRIDLSLPGERRNELTMQLRERVDGRTYFYARRWLPLELRKNARNPYVTCCLGTTDEQEARRAAYVWNRRISGNVDRKERLDAKTFAEVATLLIEHLNARSALIGRHGKPLENPRAVQRVKTALKRYLVPFFGEYEISSISPKLAQAYLTWRKRFYIDGPGASVDKLEYERGGRRLVRPLRKSADPAHSTLNKDVVAFNKVLDYARTELEIDLPHTPRIALKTSRHDPPSRRLRFYDDEWQLLIATILDRAINPNGVVKTVKALDTDVIHTIEMSELAYQRHLLYYYVMFLFETGIRVSEANWLQVKHLELLPATEQHRREWDSLPSLEEVTDEDQAIRASLLPLVNGKLQRFRIHVAEDNPALKQRIHARDVIPTKMASERIGLLLDFLYHNLPGKILRGAGSAFALPGDLYLFPQKDGSRTKSFYRSFEAALRAAKSATYPTGLTYRDGSKRSLSSIRHTYASLQIEAGATRNGIGTLADNMGTSTEMIRRHYGQALKETRADDLQLY
jgi:integrase